jgi:phage baseplate assembly protein W
MPTLPNNVGFATEIEYVSQPSLTWIVNRDTMRIQGTDEGLESIRQAVEIILNTERYQWQIYTSDFGNELDDLIGDSAGYVESEFPRMVTEALTQDDRIREVTDFKHSRNGSTMIWSFTVNSVYGAFNEELIL